MLWIIWLIFVVIFFALGCFHWKMAGKSISYLKVEQLMPKGVSGQIRLLGVDFQEFIEKFNHYIDYYNKTAKKQHKIQAIGYWVATAVALFSLAITLIG